MKTLKLNHVVGIVLLTFALAAGIFMAGCKKDNGSNGNTLASGDAAVAQDAESQDAVADNIDQSLDNTADQAEAVDYNPSKIKSAEASGITWTCSSQDTIHFPKTISVTFGDTTVNGENLKYTGTISITDSLSSPIATIHNQKKPWRNFIIRKIKFSNFGIVSDSSSITINGTRTVTRQSAKYAINADTTKIRLDIVDAITASLTFTITCGNYTGTFTRIVDRTREAIAHFARATKLVPWRQTFLNDTLIYNGSVTGVNLQDLAYSRVITVPVTFTRCALLYPVISKGEITATNDTKTGTITYSADGCKTIVTVTIGDKVKVIERKINRKYHKWW